MWMKRFPAESKLYMGTGEFRIRLEVRGPGGLQGRKSRRMLILMIFRRIRPLLKYWGDVFHEDGPQPMVRPELSTVQALAIDTESQKIGSRIRLRRHELGLTQKLLAAAVDMDSTHLSHIEHGRHILRPGNRARMEQVLGIRLR